MNELCEIKNLVVQFAVGCDMEYHVCTVHDACHWYENFLFVQEYMSAFHVVEPWNMW